MTDKTIAPRHRALRLLGGLALGLLTATVFAQDPWVRIHPTGSDLLLDQLRQSSQLEDYGSIVFGQLDEASIAELERRGHRIEVSENPFLVTLGEENFDPVERGSRMTLPAANPAGDFHFIQFKGPIRPEWLESLRQNGIEIVQPLHPFSYFVWASADKLRTINEHAAIRWSQPMEAGWKVQPHLRSFSNEARPTMMLISAHGDLDDRIARLRELGSVSAITPMGRHFVVVQIDDLPGDRYNELAQWPGVYTIQYIRPEAGPRGEMSNQSVVGNYDGSETVFPGYATWLGDTGFDGTGIIVGVVDGRVLTTHVDLADRIVSCDGTNGSCTTSGSDSHGTHVAGAIAGTGATGTLLNGFLRGQGVAPGASIVTQEYGPFLGAGPGGMVADGMLSIYQDSARSGALLTNNSWGPTTTPQGYDIPTQQIDFIVRDADPDTPGYQTILPVWSIMNGGGDGGGACAPSSLASPDEAKNLFAVGSTALQATNGTQLSNIFRISTNSAHGPACDGRRRPDIVAPGCNTDSTTNSSNTSHSANFCGTSMASPIVSGAVAIWSQKYIAETGNPPSPALTKAVFTAAAQNLEGEPNADGVTMGHRPDRFQGYGRIDLELVMNHGLEVFMSDQETVFDSTGDAYMIGLNAVNPAEPIRIMLAWTDAPGAGLAGSTPAWVNDLDLSVETGGSTFLGNVIGADGWSATGGSADDRNNLEGVFLSPAQHGGAVNVTVTAANLAGDALNPYNPGAPSQDFALVCYNCIVGDPTFTLDLQGGPIGACVPEPGNDISFPLTVNVGTLGAYSGTVDLSTSGLLPGGISSGFSPASVSAPGVSTWTVTIDDSASPFIGSIPLNGDDGFDQQSLDLAIVIDEPLATAPNQIAPIDGATDLQLQPTLSWDPIPGVSSYQLVVFPTGIPAAIVDTEVNGTSFQIPVELDTGTEYSWRVAGLNNCGDANYSPTRTFTTRLEPVASYSASQFGMTVASGDSASSPLEIGNVGTGNLTWSVATDQLAGLAPRGVIDPALDEVLNVGSFSLTGDAGGGNVEEFTIPAGVLTQGTVLGFAFEGTVSGITGNSDWASDMRMVITSPEGDIFDVGGFSNEVNAWDFQGSASANDGTYSSVHAAAFDPGTTDEGDWTLTFRHGWVSASAGTMNWSNVTVTLLKEPLPYCVDPLNAVSWLSVTPESGSVGQGQTQQVSVDVDASGMLPGSYTAYLCVSSNDPNADMTAIPVDLTVTENTDDVFEDRFELLP
ncbi:S8 family serine peptidase [Wenzhouxiangella marina]|uniref:Uncharacterized protein n=1 Tax=Wenzhouxiangella marina TaxID=1579979 RepID=A0A0K0XW31_9GAMM|nr:S8 family serine peptidase [Wenzhouxiangella marina]AKS41888.1 hypothetical protein WM2015_1518 [Wenzhouxiangella marina]MBB6086345.1 subtilisin family serine protease [Wenzhouxiangella marina]